MTDSGDPSQEQFAPSRHINALIHLCFHQLSEDDRRRFTRQFRILPQESDQIMHTLRELVLGAYLASTGLDVRYHCLIAGRTPDWCILDEKGIPVTFVELTNFHIDETTELDIEAQRRAKRIAVVWRDANKDNVTRLYHLVCRKAQECAALAVSAGIPYAIALFGDFRAALDFADDVSPCLFDSDSGVFMKYPEVSGMLYFEEASGRYLFKYAASPFAARPLELKSGAFPIRAA